MAHTQLGKSLHFNQVGKEFLRIGLVIGFWLVLFSNGLAQGGDSSPHKKDTSGKADQNLKSIAHVNPSTLAMEMSVPLMNYPGRNGNSLPVGFSYSSKIWRMDMSNTWFYRISYSGAIRYVTDIKAKYAERTAAGWTSSLTPPRIDERIQIYNQDGEPFNININETRLNGMWQNVLTAFAQNGLMAACGMSCSGGWNHISPNSSELYCRGWSITYCEDSDPGSGGGGGGEPPPPQLPHYVKRLQVSMGDGSMHEFRADDTPIQCGAQNSGCTTDLMGTFLAVDGSGVKLIRNTSGSILLMPDGSKYVFPATQQVIGEGIYAESFLDTNGNQTSFSVTNANNQFIGKQTDTLGREMIDPLPHNWRTQTQTLGKKTISLPGLGGQPQNYELTWQHLKPEGCEISTDPNCGAADGALEDLSQKLYYEVKFMCRGNIITNLLTNPNNPDDPVNEVLFPRSDLGVRPCNSFNMQTNPDGTVILGADRNPIPFAVRSNPIVLSKVKLPNGKSYQFKYNRYGEISKIVYPTGSSESFVYDRIAPIGGVNEIAYDQTNRGVVERRVYDSNGTLQQRWQYSAEYNVSQSSSVSYKVTTIAPKGDNPLGNGIRTERFLVSGEDLNYFGFSNPLAGFPLEEKTFDENNVLRSRSLSEYITKNSSYASRDPRVKRTVSVAIENGLALASLSETEYNETGTAGNNAQTDPEYFSHLNVKRTKGYHFATIPLNTAQTGNLQSIAGYFNSSLLASVAETDYLYDANYKARGIASLPIESRVLNPANGEVLAKTRTIYDNAVPAASSNYAYLIENYGIAATFNCPTSSQAVTCWQSPGSTALGHPTTSRLWDSDNNIWIETHTRYDIFGNAIKVKDAAGNEAETIFENTTEKPYLYAYPTKVITPAPDPTGTHGTNQGSFATTTYDFMTGLSLTATNEFGQTTKTEYVDALLRPTRISGVGSFVIPVTETVYDDNALTVKVRKQIDTNNWDEAISYSDSLGRTVLTQAKDSQGDVFTETKYDFLGRVKRTTNPYRLNDANNPKLWSRPRYDALGRVYETCGPVTESLLPSDSATDQNPPCPTGASLGVTQYGISTQAGFIGTYILTTDAAGKQSRALSNSLGQLARVDEPDHAGAITPLPQSTPNPSPTPSPSGTPRGGGGGGQTGCAIGTPSCLTAADYPMNSTYYYYNAQGKMVEVIQGDQHRYFKYDSLGRLIRVRQPEQTVNASLDKPDVATGNNQWSAGFSYDLLGNVITATDANGTVITNAYDKANRVVTKSYANETNGQTTPAVEYFYDGKGLSSPQSPNFAKGKLTKVTSSVSETLYTNFDELGRLLRMEQRTPVTGETLVTAVTRVSCPEYT
jgi:YD repeat-containing protein